MKIVLTGDLHLGRTSTKLPQTWRAAGRSIQGWQRLVDAVIAEKADLLLLSGDILDNRNQLWEAMGPFQEGVLKLHAAGIRCLGICGNHDATSLPDLATQLPEEAFKLLGKLGQWQRETLLEHGQAVLHVDGWSFQAPTMTEDPTLSYPLPAASDGIPVLAMVHGDPGVQNSVYAPLNLTRLQSLPVSAWLLGHIHRSLFTPGSPWILMPGSPHPLDPGEAGAHHAWLCELKDGSLHPPQPFCPAALRYEEIQLEIRPEDPVSIEWISGRLQEALQALASSTSLSIRVHLTGVSSDLKYLESLLENLSDWNLSGVSVESVRMDVHPAFDFDRLAQAGPVQELLVNALKELPSDLQARLDQVCQSLIHQNEFSAKQLPPLDAKKLPVTRLMEKTLRASLEQLS